MDDKETQAAEHSPYPYWMMFILLLVALSCFIDRVIVAALGPAIKADLGISDAQFGLLTGLAFALLYTTAGIPVARLADQGRRVTLLAVATTIWSLMTMASAYAASYWHLLLLRLGVGIGEAAASPCTVSMVSDKFPRNKRATALAVVALGASFGSLIGGFGGGWLGETVGWRHTFLIVGAPGLLLALLILTVKEPIRGRFDDPASMAREMPSFVAMLGILRAKRTFLHLGMACGLNSFVNFGILLFLPMYFGRAYEMSMTQAGLLFGIVTAVSNGTGTLLGGMGADWAGKRDERWYAWLPALCLLCAAPLYMIGLSMPNWQTAMPLVVIGATLAFTYYAPTFGAIQNMVEPRMRGTASAIIIFFQNLVGMGIGPLFVGFLSDTFAARAYAGNYAAECHGAVGQAAIDCAAAGTVGIRYGMIICASFAIWAGFHYWRASRTLKNDVI
ncbi:MULTISPECIES: spinster family MFS transporter [Sphingobium]|uniref:spinster family MFS transporter n=1 Tax=Sphingobium TaxID=165695 RepID=UPI0015EC3A0A|nr:MULTISPECIES: MFS transporter [Sphingobium]MCW2363140.1 putative MFS family arabinose efflux permease [Sphingobium sp. B10D3B]MCW2400180.1 putative MFS family arabinose efflux permease [Sphingobium sp. B10D7B]MCW2407158.1 putative MFS family arabinose efflux permease [Sphingobium xanthum]